MSDPTTMRRVYGRRQAFKLRDVQQHRVEHLLPHIRVPTEGALDSLRLFGDSRAMELEIGFGKGEHLAWQAAQDSAAGYIGCEPFLNGVTGLLAAVDRDKLENVRIHDGDAIEVLERLAPASLRRVYLLHPDPWPKQRHAKRRFVNPGPLDLIARALEPGGEFRIATDHPVYMRWALLQMQKRDDFQWLAENPHDWESRPADWPATRYGQWAADEGRPIWHFRYRRLS